MAVVLQPGSRPGSKDPTATLQDALKSFKATLDSEQQRQFLSSLTQPQPDALSVVTFMTQVDLDTQSRAGRCMSSRLGVFLTTLQQFTGVVDTFVSSNPPIAALVWGGVKIALITANNFTSYFDKVTKLIMDISKSCPVFGQLNALFPSSIDLQAATCQYYVVIVRLCEKIVEVSQRTTFQQLYKSVIDSFDSEFRSFRDDLDQATKDVKLQLLLASEIAARHAAQLAQDESKENQGFRLSIMTFSSETRKAWEEESRQIQLRGIAKETLRLKLRILDNLSKINSFKAWNHIHQRRATNTVEWLQHDRDYLNWKSDRRSAVLWCPGTLGVGKTILASHCVSLLSQSRQPDDVICHHFCQADHVSSLSAKNIIGTIVRQILALCIDSASIDHLRKLAASTEDLGAEKMFDLVLPKLEDQKTYFIILDGLDEADKAELHTVAQSMARLCRSRPEKFKIMCTVRREVAKQLQSYKWTESNHEIQLTKARFLEDVDNFVREALKLGAAESKLTLNDPSLIFRIAELLKEQSDGIFLWTRLFIDEMCAQETDNDVLHVLENPPRGISQLLDQKMERLKKQNAVELALRTLQYCAVSKRPLTTSGGHNPLRSSKRKKIPVQPHDLNGFVERELDLHLGCLCMTYLDFNDFETELQTWKAKPKGSIYPLQLAMIPAMQSSKSKFVVKSAQNYLQSLSRRQVLSHDSFQRKTQELVGISSAEPQSQGNQFMFLKYARTQWIYHLVDLNPNGNAQMWRLFCKFVENKDVLANKVWQEETTALDTSSKVDELRPIFEWAITNQHHALLSQLVLKHAGSLTKRMRERALCSATTTNHYPLVTLCLNNLEPEVDTLNTALMCAVKSGHGDSIAALIGRGARVAFSAGIPERSVLQAAAEGGHLNVVERLLAAGADVNAAAAYDCGRTALQAAVEGGHLDVVAKLLAAGADVNAAAARYDGRTALQAAAKGGHLNVVERLLVARADVNAAAAEYTGRTALEAAVEEGHAEIVEILKAAGARR